MSMAKVFSPNKDYTGTSATVDFTQGVGECADPHLLAWFQGKGYTVELNLPVPEPIEEEKVEVKPETPKRKTTRTKSE